MRNAPLSHLGFQHVRRGGVVGLVVLLAVVLLLPAAGVAQVSLPATTGFQGEDGVTGVVDTRTGRLAPTAEQLAVVSRLGATVRWNAYGTPASLIRYGNYLATGFTGSPTEAARSFIRANRALFGLSEAQVAPDRLERINDSPMTGSSGHAILFRQKFGSLPAGQDGLITVAISAGRVAYVSSSAIRNPGTPLSATLSATDAWTRAAAQLGRAPAGAIGATRTENDWTVFDVPGFPLAQRARLVALPSPGGVRPAWESNVVDTTPGANMTAHTSFVDARSGAIPLRVNRMEFLAQAPLAQTAPQAQPFQGTYSATTCGRNTFTVGAGNQSIQVIATAANVVNDIELFLDFGTANVASSDTATSPEAISYTPAGGVPAGQYTVRVCSFQGGAVLPPNTYAGTFTASSASSQAVPYPPRWRFFPANPRLGGSDEDTRQTRCWVNQVDGQPVQGCTNQELFNLAARGPWDFSFRTGTPTFTTTGNAARSAEAWSSPLTPGATSYQPVSQERNYTFPWRDTWRNNGCAQTAFAPEPASNRNDIDAATVNLFSEHNRFHDWSYFLGFTEANYNLQDSNFGNSAPGPFPLGRENDPELGQVQAGALSGGQPSFLGRDNANQITLQDGIPGITNMYLWQPITAAFYPPCVDGDYDQSVIGHEYTHAISNRMVAGPDSGLQSDQGRAMGESWSDLTAVEYLNEYRFVPTDGENRFSVGAYVTGNRQSGIRNYGMNASPLNYSDVGYDFVCNQPLLPTQSGCASFTQVHADGEIWSAANYSIRQSLINKYNASFPESSATLQRDCGDGKLAADRCPGNRRWMQIVFDAYLLQGAETSMLDARDAYLTADLMRFGGANQTELWREFARRGMGVNARSLDGDDVQPTPSFETPRESNEATLNFTARNTAENSAVAGTLYVGDYEARVTPVADTDPSTELGTSVKFVPGTYNFVFRAPGHGLRRFTLTFGSGQTLNRELHLARNIASAFSGASASGDGANHDGLIDDTEASNWVATGRQPSVAGTQVTVDLAGGARTVRSVQVSAMLRTPDPANARDSTGQSRFSALRQFAIETCTVSATSTCAANLGSAAAGFTRIYSSPANAFPSTVPRPLAPTLNLRGFDVPDTSATHVRLVVLSNQCTGQSLYGDTDMDAVNNADCVSGSAQDNNVRAAELQVFESDASTRPPGDPAVAMTMTAPASATRGATVNYDLSYTNLGPEPSANASVTDVLPAGLDFVSAAYTRPDGTTANASYDGPSRTVRWALGTVPLNFTGTLRLVTRVSSSAAVPSVIANQAQFAGDLTYSLPATAATTVTG